MIEPGFLTPTPHRLKDGEAHEVTFVYLLYCYFERNMGAIEIIQALPENPNSILSTHVE